MDKIIVLKAILRINYETYIEGFICINKEDNSIIKCIFCLDKVSISVQNGKIKLCIEEYDPEEDDFWSECVFVSTGCSIDFLGYPRTYNLNCTNIDNIFATLEVSCVENDPFVLKKISQTIGIF